MKKLIFIFLIVFITSCSQFTPFEDMRREAGQVPPVGRSTNSRPVICYNPLWHDDEDLQKLADEACARTNKKAVFQDKEYFACRLVNPAAAIYSCQ